MWLDTIQPFLRKIEQEGQAAWEEIVRDYDEYSVREFLEIKGWSEAAIERFGLIYNQECHYEFVLSRIIEGRSRSVL